jgi:outer membrane murein-binding lipoprotein Lpp
LARPKPSVSALTRILLFAAAVCLVSGCVSNGYQKGDVAAASMQKAATEVQAEQRALDGTVAALGELMNAQGGDLSIPFKRYSYSLDRLIAAAHRTETTGKTMEVKNAAYVDAWDRQLQSIDYQHIRDLSEARRTEVTNRMETVSRRYRESRQRFNR